MQARPYKRQLFPTVKSENRTIIMMIDLGIELVRHAQQGLCQAIDDKDVRKCVVRHASIRCPRPI